MASDRRTRAGVASLGASAALVLAGVVAHWAVATGFWATALVALMAAAGIAATIRELVVRPRAAVAARGRDQDGDRERSMLRVLVDQVPGALLAVEGDRVRALNRAARQLFSTDDRVLPVPPALLSAAATRLRHGGRGWRIDRVAVDGLGAVGALIALVDVEAQEHAAEARATRELLQVLGHEVMNAMAPIASLADSARAVLDLPERRDRLLPEILGTLARRADGLRRFTEVYRQVARLPEPTLVPVALADVLADVARLFAAEWHTRATLDLAAAADTIVTLDSDQIVQALLALLRNGVEAAGAGTTVRLAAIVDAHRLVFAVADDGPGVAPQHRRDIFLPFFTTRPDGNGIGLAAARQIAQGHGGDVVLRAGEPTRFDLLLPR